MVKDVRSLVKVLKIINIGFLETSKQAIFELLLLPVHDTTNYMMVIQYHNIISEYDKFIIEPIC